MGREVTMRVVVLALAIAGGCMTTWGTDVQRDSTVSETGGSSIYFLPDQTGAIRSDYIPVAPSSPYIFQAALKSDNDVATEDLITLYVEWYTRAKASISSSDVYPDAYVGSASWVPVEASIESPSTAGFARLVAEKTLDTNSADFWVDRFVMNPFVIGFSARLSSNQTYTTGGSGTIQVDSEWYDFGSNYDSSSTYKFTAPMAGVYTINGTVLVQKGSAPSSGMNLNLSLRHNSTYYYFALDSDITVSYQSNYLWLRTCSKTLLLSKGDTLELYMSHTDSGTLYVMATHTQFSVHKVQ